MFEIIEKDGLARIGKLKTAHGIIETPNLLPVYNPNIPLITPNEMKKIGMNGLITNAYIIYNTPELREQATKGVHSLISYDGIIMTDSGAYQSWMYREELEVSNQEIVEFQDLLKPDIGTILDIFTDTDSHEEAEKGVETTHGRGIEALNLRQKDSGILWAGPIQGGQFLDLVEKSARLMSELEFDYHPLGTLAPSLMSYNYKQVAEQIIVARLSMIQSRPLHAFSIGHPMFFSLAIACGADIFDSSAYALFAKNDRYLTNMGTLRLEKIHEFPCSCPICLKYKPKELLKMTLKERQCLIAEHNLYVTFQELKSIRQAIRTGRIWELVQTRVSAHPALLEAFRYILKKYGERLEPYELASKSTAFFYADTGSLDRPEIRRHQMKMQNLSLNARSVLLLVPEYPLNDLNLKFKRYVNKILEEIIEKERHLVQVAHVSPLFGIILEDLQGTYPLIQNEYPLDLCNQIPSRSLQVIENFMNSYRNQFSHIILYDPKDFQDPDIIKYNIKLQLFQQVVKNYESSGTVLDNHEHLKIKIERIFKN
ncbi:MAG: tRNA guanosine(15) transglycosylase TgtA [Candidatus Helarchaeota archaeon]